MSNTKMNKDTIPKNFTLSLALVDGFPVIFCGLSLLLISYKFHSALFLLGSILILGSGAIKVLWKIIVAIKKKNIWWMFIQMRIFMPLGFLFLILSLFIHHDQIHFSKIQAALFSFPSSVFFLLGFIGMALMIVFAIKLDSSDVKSNWIEQFTNGLAQLFFFIGLLLLK